MTEPTSGRQFTDAARAAALEVRREKILLKNDLLTPTLFVVRHCVYRQLFGWEIRRFGGVVLSRSEIGYVSQSQARLAGQIALDAMVPV